MPESERRRPGLWSLWLLAGLLLLGTGLVGALVQVECPDCKGGRQVQMSIGPMPCRTCAQGMRVPLWRSVAYGLTRRF